MNLLSYADRAVRLVNTYAPLTGADRLANLDDLRALLEPYPLWLRKAGSGDLEQLRTERAVLREIFEEAEQGRQGRAVERLNGMLAEHPVRPHMTDHDKWPWHLHLAETSSSAAEGYLATAAFGLAIAVTTVGLGRFGVCHSGKCRSVFLDSSTNRSRRYCSERCATRANVAAYRAGRRESATAGV